jgi:hypothetical protein
LKEREWLTQYLLGHDGFVAMPQTSVPSLHVWQAACVLPQLVCSYLDFCLLQHTAPSSCC